MDPQQIIESTRDVVRRAQASYSDVNWQVDRIKKPLSFYLIMDRRFDQQFRDQRILLERGSVVWGALVQANQILFDPRGPYKSLPGVVMYSADPRYDAEPDLLREHAHGLFELKGEKCTPEMQAFADKLADEIVADVKLAIPTGFTDGAQCFYSTLLIPRKHLPANHLADGLFPVLVAPQETDVVIVLPQAYWDPQLRSLWQQA